MLQGLEDLDLPEEPTQPTAHQDDADFEVTQLVPALPSARSAGLDQHQLTAPRTMIDAPPPALRHPRRLRRPGAAGGRLPHPRRTGRPVRASARSASGAVAWWPCSLVLLLTTTAALAGWYLTAGRFTSAPALAGISQAEAEQVASRVGSGHPFAEEYSETVQRGVVISTDPGAGTKIIKGGRIDAAVSRGPERHTMPVVVGLTQEAAEKAVQRANLAVGKVKHKYSDSVRDGAGARRLGEGRRQPQAGRGRRPGRLPRTEADSDQELRRTARRRRPRRR